MPGTNELELQKHNKHNTAEVSEGTNETALDAAKSGSFGATNESQLRDIKPLMNMNIEYRSMRPYFVPVFILAVLAYAVWKYLNCKEPEMEAIKEVIPPPPPPYDTAVSDLEKLYRSGLLEKSEFKLWYMGISKILRNYIGAILNFNCIDLDISEILPALKKAEIKSSYYLEIEDILGECDLVKFAKYSPDKSMALEIYKKVFDFIKKNGNNNLK